VKTAVANSEHRRCLIADDEEAVKKVITPAITWSLSRYDVNFLLQLAASDFYQIPRRKIVGADLLIIMFLPNRTAKARPDTRSEGKLNRTGTD
jgi:hypothetical protein